MRFKQPIHQKPRAVFWWISIAFFFQGMTPGFWLPPLTNILQAKGLGMWVAAAFMVPPLCALVSPLVGGALADQRVAADRLYVWTSLIAGGFLLAAFGCLDAGLNPWWFLAFLGLYAIFTGPSWGLLTVTALTHLPNVEREFPLVRVGAAIGWMTAGAMTSYLFHADDSAQAGYAAGFARILGALLAILLPQTPPLGKVTSWRSQLGLDSFQLLKQRDLYVFFTVTTLFSVPLTAFYMYAPELLKVLGNTHAAATMVIAQFTEILAMLLVGRLLLRYRMKTILLWALGLSAIRYGMSAYAGHSGMIAWHVGGIALHGICFTFYFITAPVFLDQRVAPGLRGQAQGLLALVTGGIGPLVGAMVCGWLHEHFVTANGQGWMAFWSILAGMIAVCFIILAIFYQETRRLGLTEAPDGESTD
ncbi:MAG: MFS transporter [Gloeobacteraceae cyanobacterium ES-bin-144]|nr:MFS transporter [Verrucomicrobiales bacterium]